ncbi:hypothetical protein [Bradyrhizobium sp. RDI18]|uniref:hypothetical protein n=1 Tax=Bradyrhizobium sp. RDI18 TaxID=3367400 RepID=UPI00371188D2
MAELADHFSWRRSSTFNLLFTLSEEDYLYEPRLRGRLVPYSAPAHSVSEGRALGSMHACADCRRLPELRRLQTRLAARRYRRRSETAGFGVLEGLISASPPSRPRLPS